MIRIKVIPFMLTFLGLPLGYIDFKVRPNGPI